MRIRHSDSKDDAAEIFHLSGALSYRDHDTFTRMIEDVSKGENRRVVIDLSRLSMVDSFGVGLFLVANDKARQAHNHLIFANPCGAVRRVFELAALNTVLTVEDAAAPPPPPQPSRPAGGLSLETGPGQDGDDQLVVRLEGRFTFADQDRFEQLIASVVATPAARVTLDLSGLEFMDSTGLSMLLIAREEAAKARIRLALAGARGRVRTLLDLACVDDLLETDHA
jgi:anti-anti-sigma factor